MDIAALNHDHPSADDISAVGATGLLNTSVLEIMGLFNG